MASTAPRKHFDEDIVRAKGVLSLAKDLEDSGSDGRLHQDTRWSAVAMAVGAMDAYFCDAYVDCLTSVLRAYTTGYWNGDLPSVYAKRELPAGVVLSSSQKDRPLWAIRMAARKIMERDNMLAISRIEDQFNGILPQSQKIWTSLVEELVSYNYKRFTGTTESEISKLSGKALGDAKRKAISTLKKRIGDTIQKRHDWVHNCGRPKTAIMTLNHHQAAARIREIDALVVAFDDHIQKHRLV